MEKDKYTLGKKIWIAIEALVGLFVIWLACSVFTGLLTMVLMAIVYGECTAVLVEEYYTLIKIGYGTILAVCIAEYLRRLYRKYSITDQYGNKR